MSGSAFVGNIGYTGDRLDIDPSTGAVLSVVGMQVTCTTPGRDCSTPEGLYEEQAQVVREVSSWKAAVDLNGPVGGRAYFGGFHGMSGLSGMTQSQTSRLCGDNCPLYEEHLHPFSPADALGRDVRAIAITTMGDVWVGDADSIWFVPQRSAGASADYFQNPVIPGQSATYLDVFPNVADMVFGIAVDGGGGVWVASYGNGLAYLTPGSYAPTYWSTANGLPSNYLTGVAVDADGTVWVGTTGNGVARYTPKGNKWEQLTTASGLPSNDIHSVYVDKYGDGRSVLFATDNGAAVWHP
jgi:ligand-binding sensor domain-containing protein